MDRTIVQRRLAAAEHRVDMGELRLARQRAIVERRRDIGLDSGEAEELLVEFEQQQTTDLADLERLREQLAAKR